MPDPFRDGMADTGMIFPGVLFQAADGIFGKIYVDSFFVCSGHFFSFLLRECAQGIHKNGVNVCFKIFGGQIFSGARV